MDQALEFISNHTVLVGAWFLALIGLVVNEKRRAGKAFTPQQTVMRMNRDNALVIDVREPKDYKDGHVAGALNWPINKLDSFMAEVPKYAERPLIVVCKVGTSAGAAVKKISAAGHTDVARMSGGMMEWNTANLPLKK